MNRKDPFVTDRYYHVYNRGTDKRAIFINANDYTRFAQAMIEFNSFNSIVFSREAGNEKHEDLVEILVWTLMPNHFHFLLKQKTDGGISKFLQKLLTSYTMYFNKRYERSGSLFQGTTKSILIGEDPYLLQLARYIYLNPLELTYKKDSKEEVTSEVIEKLIMDYPWNNLSEFISQKENIILSQLPKGDFLKFICDWGEYKRNVLTGFELDNANKHVKV